jgi:hypothetical protein
MAFLKLKWKKKRKKIAKVSIEPTSLRQHSSSESPLPTALREIFNLHDFKNWIFTFISIYK